MLEHGDGRSSFDAALSTCDVAIVLAPNAGQSLDSRGFVLLRLRRYAEAIAAYDAALKARAGQGTSLYGRGVAEHLEGDALAGDADLKAALALDAHVATVFADYGVRP